MFALVGCISFRFDLVLLRCCWFCFVGFDWFCVVVIRGFVFLVCFAFVVLV